jgi:excisionase family DNA binding protein
LTGPLSVDLSPAAIEKIASVVKAEVMQELAIERKTSPYLTVNEAADYLRCSAQRIYDLCCSRKLAPLKDGSRSLFRRDDLDAVLSSS